VTSLLGERGAIMARTPRAPNLVYHERFERPLSAWESYGTVPQQWARAPSPDLKMTGSLRLAERKKELKPERRAEIREALGQRSIALIGLMGAGKTAVGRRLANRLDLAFTDVDDEIELAAGASISEIFAVHGEAYFRQGERKVIARLLEGGPQVLATGGGAYMNAETRANIKKHGISIWLKAELPVLLHRVRRRDHRPLLATGDPETVMRALMQERYPVYAEADITVESRDVPHEMIVNEVVEALSRKLGCPAPPAAPRRHGES
jgi:shikimate kinase